MHGINVRTVSAKSVSVSAGVVTHGINVAGVGPDRELETLSGPLAHLGRITGMEIPGTSAETAVRDMVSNAAPVPASDA
jgi:hypothetical protein